MRIFIFVFLFLACASFSLAQENVDSAKTMNEIIISAYDANTILGKAPAAVSVITKSSLKSLSAFSIVPAFNNVAGVRMEERSPGSYRLSIRGSLLRSPFGVRNVKIYLNDFMLTDAGGNSYLNLLDVTGIDHAEIIKGPAGSVYGAGTGGAIIFSNESFSGRTSGRKLSVSAGSFGTFTESFSFQHGSKKFKAKLVQGHTQSNGYRVQTALRKDNLQYQFTYQQSVRTSIDGFFLFSNLHYETPGGLTAAQYASDPRQARPATPTIPSTVDQRTGIFNKTGLFGISSLYKLTERWSNKTSLTGSVTGFSNPFLTNYEKRNESNIGLRTKFVYERKGEHPMQWITGAEIQYGNYKIDSSGNVKGKSDGRSVVDKVKVNQAFAFTQFNFSPTDFLRFQLGASLNTFDYSLDRVKGIASYTGKPIGFDPQFLPRFAVMVDPLSTVGFYVQVAKGYSAPTIAEVKPSAGGFFDALQAEKGWNTEVGLKIRALGNRLIWSMNYFDFRLTDAIVRQTNPSGAEYFVNAGAVNQKGIESELQLLLLKDKSRKILQKVVLSQSTTINDFLFSKYKLGAIDFSDNKLTGVPSEVFTLSLIVDFASNFYANINLNHTGNIPLNDANTATSSAYDLMQMKVGWKKRIKKTELELFALADNVLNSKYSLGNDLNAFGSRFFNAAPSRNFLIGFEIGF